MFVNRFKKFILLVVQYKYLKSCSLTFFCPNLILRTKLCGTMFIFLRACLRFIGAGGFGLRGPEASFRKKWALSTSASGSVRTVFFHITEGSAASAQRSCCEHFGARERDAHRWKPSIDTVELDSQSLQEELFDVVKTACKD